jgi:hypothetical protein
MTTKKRQRAARKCEADCSVLRMTEQELDLRLSRALDIQPGFAANSNFVLTGFDAAKVIPTAKAIVIALGLVEITPNIPADGRASRTVGPEVGKE